MKINVIELVVKKDHCIGCGVCAALCPQKVLSMEFNDQGIYKPYESPGCLDSCKLCLEVCPFYEENPVKEQISEELFAQENVQCQHDIGYFLCTLVAHNKNEDERLKSASGGAGYNLLRSLMENNLVDAVIAPIANTDSEILFKYSIIRNKDDLSKTRGSVYYPLELSSVLKYVIENEGSYAITSLPCMAKAIRLAQDKNIKLRSRIKYVIGLTCGQMKSKHFTEELAKIAIGSEKLDSVNYRVKQINEPSSNFAFEFKGLDGKTNTLSWKDEINRFWGYRLFTPMACNQCDDVFAETADIALMDAWLPEYTSDYRGNNLIIVRNKMLNDLMQNDESMSISSIPWQSVRDSQISVIENKKAFSGKSNNFLLRMITGMKKEIQKLSNTGYEGNLEKVSRLIKTVRMLERLRYIFTLPVSILKKVHGKKCGIKI